jgi:hypothetical protein
MLPLPGPVNNFTEQINRDDRIISTVMPLQIAGGYKFRMIMYRALGFMDSIPGGQL